jgi:hypothetical protein
MNTRQAQLEWLGKILAETGLTRHGLAVKAGIPPQTLNMFVAAKATHSLSSGNLEKIYRATGYRYGSDRRVPPRPIESELYKVKSKEDFDFVSSFDGSNGFEARVLGSRALECAGYLPGDVLIIDRNTEAKPGDIVCARIFNWQGSGSELIFRVWEPPFLQSATFDPALRQIFTVDNDLVLIEGVVVFSVRRRMARAA